MSASAFTFAIAVLEARAGGQYYDQSDGRGVAPAKSDTRCTSNDPIDPWAPDFEHNLVAEVGG